MPTLLSDELGMACSLMGWLLVGHLPSSLSFAGGAAALLMLTLISTAGAQTVNPTASAMKSFRDRADAYLALHKKVADEVPRLKETDDPQKIADREKLLGVTIARARSTAQPGEIFGEIAPRVVKIVRDDMRHRRRADRRALFAEMPARVPPVDINAMYPSSVPLITFPPSLLQSLPPLPEGLEYRFYGRHLILRDVKANIVADILRDVLPTT